MLWLLHGHRQIAKKWCRAQDNIRQMRRRRRAAAEKHEAKHKNESDCFRWTWRGCIGDRNRGGDRTGQSSVRVLMSLAIGMPPKMTAVLIFGKYFENRSYSFLIWNASSRVWHITITATSPSTGSICWRVARTNTAVLPIPVEKTRREVPPPLAISLLVGTAQAHRTVTPPPP